MSGCNGCEGLHCLVCDIADAEDRLPCPGCSRALMPMDLCVHPNPACWSCCVHEHYDEEEHLIRAAERRAS